MCKPPLTAYCKDTCNHKADQGDEDDEGRGWLESKLIHCDSSLEVLVAFLGVGGCSSPAGRPSWRRHANKDRNTVTIISPNERLHVLWASPFFFHGTPLDFVLHAQLGDIMDYNLSLGGCLSSLWFPPYWILVLVWDSTLSTMLHYWNLSDNQCFSEYSFCVLLLVEHVSCAKGN